MTARFGTKLNGIYIGICESGTCKSLQYPKSLHILCLLIKNFGMLFKDHRLKFRGYWCIGCQLQIMRSVTTAMSFEINPNNNRMKFIGQAGNTAKSI